MIRHSPLLKCTPWENMTRNRKLSYWQVKLKTRIIVKSSFSSLNNLIDEMRVHARPFILTADSVSRSECQMPGLNISLCSDGVHSRCVIGLYKTIQHLASYQPWEFSPFGVHHFWPRAENLSVGEGTVGANVHLESESNCVRNIMIWTICCCQKTT